MDSLCLRTGLPGVANLESRPSPSKFVGGVMKTALLRYSFNRQFRSLVPGAKQGMGVKGAALDDAVLEQSEGQNGKWVMKILHLKSLWSEKGEDDGVGGHEDESYDLCDCEYGDDEETETMVFDRSSFSKLLKRVSLGDARLYGQMSYLGNLAYAIPTIKEIVDIVVKELALSDSHFEFDDTEFVNRKEPGNRLRRYGLRYVTSSIEKRQELANAESQQPSNQSQRKETGPLEAVESKDDRNEGPRIDPSSAFQIAASAASYLNSRTRRIFGSGNAHIDREHIDEVASFMATTDSVTAVVAAKEEVKQAVADDLNSVRSAPCEWYICDDDKTTTRFFVIQGSETLASWQANLLFEPIKFEGFDIFVHRGIYEAAKGIYQQMLPEILAHTKAHGRRARLRFTGHSLGGSLSLLINLMLLIRGEVPLSSLLPVITFGSPTIMCGGDNLLRKLGLPRSHIQAVTMHRDIVPRAFSCNYPNHVAELLKAVNGNFRHHPCLNNQKILYAPMGELLILQPDANYSPQHDLLPPGSGLFHLDSSYSDADEAEQLLRAAKLEFLNSPHPLEILSDRSAYGTGGSIHRDHDMNSYLKCVRSVIRHELSRLRKAKRERRRKSWWARGGVLGGLPGLLGPPGQVDISGILRSGSESLRRVSRIVASNNLHLLVLLLFPARWWLVGAFSIIAGFRLR